MSTSFSANQYRDAFKSKKLGNWQCPSSFRESPDSRDGETKVIANDRGHLLSGIPRSKKNPWGNFVGTWHLPDTIPGNFQKIDISRTKYAQEKIDKEAAKANFILSGKKKNEERLRSLGNPVQVDRSVELTSGAIGAAESAERAGSQTGSRSGARAPASQMITEPSRTDSVRSSALRSPAAAASRQATPTTQRVNSPHNTDNETAAVSNNNNSNSSRCASRSGRERRLASPPLMEPVKSIPTPADVFGVPRDPARMDGGSRQGSRPDPLSRPVSRGTWSPL